MATSKARSPRANMAAAPCRCGIAASGRRKDPRRRRTRSRPATSNSCWRANGCKGSWVLVRIRNNRGRDTRTNWLLIKHKDEYASPGRHAGADRRRSLGGFRPHHGADSARCRQGAPPVHVSQGRRRRCGWHSNRTESKPVAAPKRSRSPNEDQAAEHPCRTSSNRSLQAG